MSSISPRQRLQDHLRTAGLGQALAVGWATVDLDRGIWELGASLGLATELFEDAADSVLLGARCRFAAGVLDGVSGVLILEPNTEGRLAASLARHDEGPIALWLRAEAGDAVGASLSAEEPGPLGPERLDLAGPAHGPHRLVVGSTGTIAT
jgi:hypothetical protein